MAAQPEGGRGRLPLLHLAPNLVTVLALCAGLTSIRFAIEDRFEPAAALIVIAAMLDGLDGLLARRLNSASVFGAELDSLSDFLSFGVAPGLLLYRFALEGGHNLGWIAVLAYASCCALRLARFNTDRDKVVTARRAHFVGVPAPAGALLALLPVGLSIEGIWIAPPAWLIAGHLALVGYLMICRLPTFSPKGVRVSRELSRWLLVGAAVVVGVMVTRTWLLLVLLDAAYAAMLVHSAVTAWRRPS